MFSRPRDDTVLPLTIKSLAPGSRWVVTFLAFLTSILASSFAASSNTEQSLGSQIRGFFGGRKEVEVAHEKLTQQIFGYVSVVRDVAQQGHEDSESIKLTEIKAQLNAVRQGQHRHRVHIG